MDTGSITIFGILSSILLIFSCITFTVSKMYNELAISSPSGISLDGSFKSNVNLQVRNLYKLRALK